MVSTHGDAIRSAGDGGGRRSSRGMVGGPAALGSPAYRPCAAALASAFPSAAVYGSAAPVLDAKGAKAHALALVGLLGGARAAQARAREIESRRRGAQGCVLLTTTTKA